MNLIRLTIVTSVLLLSGCAMMREIDQRRTGKWKPYADRVREENERRAQLEKVAEFKENLRPGMAMDEVVSSIGDPDRTEFTESLTIHWYDDKYEPLFLVYDRDRKLVRKLTDTDTISGRRQSANNIAIQKQLSDIESQQAWQGLSNTLSTINTQNQLDNLQRQQQINDCQSQNLTRTIKMPCY